MSEARKYAFDTSDVEAEERRLIDQRAPRDFLRIRGVDGEGTKTPVLVCERCHAWKVHTHQGDESTGTAIKEMYACTACGYLRVFGFRAAIGRAMWRGLN